MILRFLRKKIPLFLLGLGLVIPTKVVAAERVILQYGQIEFYISVNSLETYAKTGKINRDLASYTRYFSEENLLQFRDILQTPADLDHVTIANFLNSVQGEIILQKLGEVIRTNANLNGFYGIRSALILAAASPEGLTPLNVLRKFPTSEIRIASVRGLEVFNLITDTINDTSKAIAQIDAQFQLEQGNGQKPLYPLLDNLRQGGGEAFQVKQISFRDLQRQRLLPVDLYLPEQDKAPLVLISHGLGSDRSTFAYLAEHLASWGFAVAVLEHPGSNSNQIKQLLGGLANQVTPPEELLDRPLDIKFLLDELEFLYGKEVNTEQVGIIGQSFGGYTSLALAGAELNWTKLQQECNLNNNNFNGSLLLQCLPLQLPQQDYNLIDRRIAGAIAINPFTSVIFGEESLSQIDIPVMIMAGSDDSVTPALAEQIIPFTWLTSEEKYLVMMKGGTHFSTLNEESGSIPVPAQVIGPNPAIAQEYVKALSLAFFQTHIAKNDEFQTYLNANYAQYLSQWLIPLKLVQELELDQVQSQK
jgi:predicted dienelactone hydrolase